MAGDYVGKSEERIDTSRLRSVLAYNAKTGVFTWLKTRYNKRAGRMVGWLDTRGYLCLRVQRIRVRVHRLVWFYETGAWPAQEIDHRNGAKADNRIANLREASRFENMVNAPKRRDNTSGVRGVHWHRASKKWAACICAGGKHVHLGLFLEKGDAVFARAAAVKKYHKEFART